MITRRKVLSVFAGLPLFGGLFAGKVSEAEDTLHRRDRMLRKAMKKYRCTGGCRKPGGYAAEAGCAKAHGLP